ncbi:hypothetical protein J6590_034761 [Homalodisca vitripennis]|nr:hypothetical protein J6590_034761 [Homalodisca vitripennis]
MDLTHNTTTKYHRSVSRLDVGIFVPQLTTLLHNITDRYRGWMLVYVGRTKCINSCASTDNTTTQYHRSVSRLDVGICWPDQVYKQLSVVPQLTTLLHNIHRSVSRLDVGPDYKVCFLSAYVDAWCVPRHIQCRAISRASGGDPGNLVIASSSGPCILTTFAIVSTRLLWIYVFLTTVYLAVRYQSRCCRLSDCLIHIIS